MAWPFGIQTTDTGKRESGKKGQKGRREEKERNKEENTKQMRNPI